MAQLINEAKRFQKLAGILKENDQPSSAEAEQVANKVEKSLEAKVNTLTPEQIEQLKTELADLGVTPTTPVDVIANEVENELTEAEGDSKQKIASTLSGIGDGLIGSLLVPMIPVAIGISTGGGFAAGLGITLGTAALLKGLAKVLDKTKQY